MRRDLRDDGIAVGAQSSHAGGSPIAHLAKHGFRPTFSSLKRRLGESEQIRLAKRPPRSSFASSDAFDVSFHSLALGVGMVNDVSALRRRVTLLPRSRAEARAPEAERASLGRNA